MCWFVPTWGRWGPTATTHASRVSFRPRDSGTNKETNGVTEITKNHLDLEKYSRKWLRNDRKPGDSVLKDLENQGRRGVECKTSYPKSKDRGIAPCLLRPRTGAPLPPCYVQGPGYRSLPVTSKDRGVVPCLPRNNMKNETLREEEKVL